MHTGAWLERIAGVFTKECNYRSPCRRSFCVRANSLSIYPAALGFGPSLIGHVPRVGSGRCRISPPRFLAECCKRQLNQVSFVVLYFKLSTFLICIEFVYLYFPVLFCLSVSVKWLAMKPASEMTYTVSSGALNSAPSVLGKKALKRV